MAASEIFRFVSMRRPQGDPVATYQAVTATTPEVVKAVNGLDPSSTDTTEALKGFVDGHTPLAHDALRQSSVWSLIQRLEAFESDPDRRNTEKNLDAVRDEVGNLRTSGFDGDDLGASVLDALAHAELVRTFGNEVNAAPPPDGSAMADFGRALKALHLLQAAAIDDRLLENPAGVRAVLDGTVALGEVGRSVTEWVSRHAETALQDTKALDDNEVNRRKALPRHVMREQKERIQAAEGVMAKILQSHATAATTVNDEWLKARTPAPAVQNVGWVRRAIDYLFGPADEPQQAAEPDYDDAAVRKRFVADLDTALNPAEKAVFGEVFPNGLDPASNSIEMVYSEMQAMASKTSVAANLQCGGNEAESPPVMVAKPPPVLFPPGVRPGVRVLGFGDLILARESHKRYEAEEIAHIENVLPGEERFRSHKRQMTTETLTEIETDEEVEREEDTRTSQRFELQTESQRSIETDFSIEAGLNLSGSYGTVSFESNLGVEYSRNRQDSTRNATLFAREVVSRALERTREKVRELRRQRIVEFVEEWNRHRLSRVGIDTSYSGIYKWVNKIQEVELRYYGQRLMLEFYVPEPGINLLRAPDLSDLTPPPPLDFGPEFIDETNYLCLARKYRVLDVRPPPPIHKTVEWAYKRDATGEHTNYKARPTVEAKENIQIPDGYLPRWVNGIAAPGGIEHAIYVAVSGIVVFNGKFGAMPHFVVKEMALPPTVADDESGISVIVRIQTRENSNPMHQGVLQIRVLCQRTHERYRQWQLDTYASLVNGHNGLEQAYQEQMAFRQMQEGVQISGRNPLENRRVEQEELKKWSIELMRVRPMAFNSIDDRVLPAELNHGSVTRERDISLFYERAFEWSQMTYQLYPWYWGRRELWDERKQLENSDPKHLQFLQSGGARVIVPVSPGFEARVLHYMDTIDTEWNLATWEPPELTGPIVPGVNVPLFSTQPEIWMETLIAANKELSFGSGTLAVQNGSTTVDINPNSQWIAEDIDIGREIYINGAYFVISAINSATQFDIDSAYNRTDDPDARYVIGSKQIGGTWEVVVPTNLVVLADQAARLNA